jgi:hypothetical protein
MSWEFDLTGAMHPHREHVQQPAGGLCSSQQVGALLRPHGGI